MGRKCFVYIIQAGIQRHSPVKIGVANSPESRIKELQTGNPYTLILKAKIEMPSHKAAENLEYWLHKRFNHARMEGEWFKAQSINLKKAFEVWNGIDGFVNAEYKKVTDKKVYGSVQSQEIQKLKSINKSLMIENQRLHGDIQKYLDGEMQIDFIG